MKRTNYKKMAHELWQLLDDIDTASDIFKPSETNGFKSYHNFYSYSLKKASKRFDLLKSDGYKLFTPEEFEEIKRNSPPPEYRSMTTNDIINTTYTSEQLL